ncbi:glycosyltransferase involved in cell wall biosynthesis [Algoriphagus ratkowskyi]|uniref:Glycosyltransferase family 4 protein n=1 Tax=Algoriphagus ratkowskyi TaxID=57028 RepID=A0A2W7R6Q2_9BACT|nr:glycosyltransferase family 4 protein [Algoriphagus ratkowskyi]PZX49809.1 glycosyltransferase involved in cell wall biosynthesis [Algoriphagus ratkowskyi]TXD75471.1 glycosyltransferase family 4 protein [Algoriphagus ratkowskyi]
MRILFLDTEPILRGAQVFISELSYFIAKLGHEVKVVYLYQDSLKESSVHMPAMNCDNLDGIKNSFSERALGLDSRLIINLVDVVNRFNPEIVLCNGSSTLKYAVAAKHFVKSKPCWIARWIDDAVFWNPGLVSKLIYKNLIMSQFDACIGVSKASLESMIQHYDFKKPSRVIHRVFDPMKFQHALSREEARRSLGFEEKDEILLFLGNLTPQKRPDRFIEIVQKLAKTRPNIKAIIVGDGTLGVSIKSQISNLKSKIFFYGYQQDVSPYLSAADILVLTSDTEGLPGVVLEAAYFAVPTVATEVGGIAECLIDGETGLLVPDRSVDAFCHKIETLLADPIFRTHLGTNAKKFTSQHFRMDQVAQQYLGFLQQIINQP